MSIRDKWEESLLVAPFQPWDPYRALDPCLFDLALNLRRATNVSGRVFDDRKTAALMFFETKGGKKKAALGLPLSVWLTGATYRWEAGRQQRR